MKIHDTQEITCEYCGKILIIPENEQWEIMNVTCPFCRKFFPYAKINGKYVPMPKFAWKENVPPIPESLFNAAIEVTPPSGTILELGSGRTTQYFAEKRNIISIEHSQQYIGYYNELENYIYAPLVNDWYNLENVKLPKYDCLLVDGPDLDSRLYNFVLNMNLFDFGVPWFIDDINYEPFKNDVKSLIALTTPSGKNPHKHKDPYRDWMVLK